MASRNYTMPLQSIISSWNARARAQRSTELQANTGKLEWRLAEVFVRMWDLGFTSFGGPPVHFQILHRRFVEGLGFGGGSKWIDEQTVSAAIHFYIWLSSDKVLVSGDLCHLPGTARTSLHQNALYDRVDPCWSRLSHIRLPTVEPTGCYWDVCSVSRSAKDAGPAASNCVCIIEWHERKYGRYHRSGCCAGRFYPGAQDDVVAQTYKVIACAKGHSGSPDQSIGHFWSLCRHLLQRSMVFPGSHSSRWCSDCFLGHVARTEGW